MTKKITFRFIALLLLTFIFTDLTVKAQTPEQFKYQAVLRNANGSVMVNESVVVNISILKESTEGTSIFYETHKSTTTAQGLININIGSINNLGVVDWGSCSHFVKITVNGTLIGTSQLLSVPYALHANTAKKISGHYVGEFFNGGIIFYVDPTGEHGLIASLHDLDDGNGVIWSNVTDLEVDATMSMTDGASNTLKITQQTGHTNSAAQLCLDYSFEGFDDWYLPSTREFILLTSQDVLLDNILDNDDNPNTIGLMQESIAPTYGAYWTSNEYSYNKAWYCSPRRNYINENSKGNFTYRVRAIRAF